MFEALDKLLEREKNKLHPSVADPVIVRRFDDIRRVLGEIDPHNNNIAAAVQIHADMNYNENGKNVTYRVSAPSRSKSKREMIIEGLDILKRQMDVINSKPSDDDAIEVNGIQMKAPSLGAGDKSRAWVDPLIKHWLGGYRRGLTICWDIDGFHYQYDIYTHKLTREKIEAN